MGHLERSKFIRVSEHGYWAMCYRSKLRDTSRQRPAFDWFYPANVASKDTPGMATLFYEDWGRVEHARGAPMEDFTVSATTGLKTESASANELIPDLFREILAAPRPP